MIIHLFTVYVISHPCVDYIVYFVNQVLSPTIVLKTLLFFLGVTLFATVFSITILSLFNLLIFYYNSERLSIKF